MATIDDSIGNAPGIPPGTQRGGQNNATVEGRGVGTEGNDVPDQRPPLRPQENAPAGGKLMDVAKVQEIKRAIAEGRFKIDSEVVADRLIESARDLIASRRR